MGTILLVDDDEDLIDIMVELIESVLHRTCVTARSHAQAVALGPSALACEVAILDVNLGPDQPSGVDVCGWLHEQRFGGRIYFLTGHANTHPLVAAARQIVGAQVLEKPIGLDQLRALIEGGEGAR